MRFWLAAVMGFALPILPVASALAQRVQSSGGGASSVDPTAVARSLKDVDEQMTHPDPDMRIGYLDAIVAEGNARKIERAIRIAVGSKDEGLRALGMRAYFAATRSLVLESVLTSEEYKMVEEHKQNKNTRMPELFPSLIAAGFKITLLFEFTQINSIIGKVKASRYDPVEYIMRGERLTFSGYTGFANNVPICDHTITVNRDFKIIDRVNCGGPSKLLFEADMF